MKRWLPIFTGLTQQRAVEELVTRQDRVRRNGEPCEFVVRKDGESPR